MIVGQDISEFQGQIDWNTYKNNTNFVVIRSSYGVGYFDKWFGNNRQEVRQTSLPHGFYHYSYPQYNSPIDEANWFIKAIDGLQDGEFLALDFEEQYAGDKVAWCKAFLDHCKALTNVKPLIYLNQDLASHNDWQPVIDAGYGLWIAAYTYDPNNNTFNGGKWQTSVMQQWTDAQAVPGIAGNTDGDVFFGSQDQLKAYGYKTPQPIQQSPPVVNIPPEVVTPVVNQPAQPAPVVEVTPTPQILPEPVVLPSTPTPEVLPSTSGDNMPPVETKPLPIHGPVKPSMRLSDLIVFTLTNIKSVLIQLWKGLFLKK